MIVRTKIRTGFAGQKIHLMPEITPVTEVYRGKQKSSFNVSVPTPPRLKLKL
jgi:hypothetical protein